MENCEVIGLDIAKNTFYLIMLNANGKEIKRKKLSRNQLHLFIANCPTCTFALEACASAHYWGRKIQNAGHAVELLPAQHVKGYLRGQKNDYNDAKAIAEACIHAAIRSVPVKSITQQDEQTFLTMRGHLRRQKTSIINHIRGLLAEYGIVLAKGGTVLLRELPYILEDPDNELSDFIRSLLHRQQDILSALDEELQWYDNQLSIKSEQDDVCKRLTEVPGIGPVVSVVMKSWMGTGKQFKKGRDASAALGLVPRQHSTGGRDKLLGISKRGDKNVRALIVHGARAVVSRAKNKTDRLSLWINHLVEKRGFNKAVVALANKLTRISWVIICRGETYQADTHAA